MIFLFLANGNSGFGGNGGKGGMGGKGNGAKNSRMHKKDLEKRLLQGPPSNLRKKQVSDIVKLPFFG